VGSNPLRVASILNASIMASVSGYHRICVPPVRTYGIVFVDGYSSDLYQLTIIEGKISATDYVHNSICCGNLVLGNSDRPQGARGWA